MMSLDDEAESEVAFDRLIEAVRDALPCLSPPYTDAAFMGRFRAIGALNVLKLVEPRGIEPLTSTMPL